MAEAEIPKELQEQIDQAAALQVEITQKAKALKAAQQEIDETWGRVRDAMIEHNVKSFKGDFGSLTIVDRTDWDVDESKLPEEFFKRVPDKAKITSTYQLEGEAPVGTTKKTTTYLRKTIK